MDSSNLIKYTEAAKRLGVHPVTLRKWVSDHRVPFVRIPGSRCIRFSIDDLNAWLEAQSIRPADVTGQTQ